MSAFVGRGTELARLTEALERAAAGRGHTVIVTGEAGAGKSTLVERFLLEAALRVPETRIATGTCSEQFGTGEPYQPFIEAFRDLVGGREGERGTGPETREGASRAARIRDLAKRVAPYWLQTIPVAGDIISATYETAAEIRRASQGSAGTATVSPASEEALFFQYTEVLFAVAEEHPVVLFLDDLHWADQASTSLLLHMGRRMQDRRILLLGTFRPADVATSGHPVRQAVQELKRYGVAEELELPRLEESALAELLAEELGGQPSPELSRFLVRRAGSNPLFFEELLHWVRDRGLLREIRGEWRLAELPAEIEIPASAESAIERRLDRLDEDVRHILEYAAVLGDEFDSLALSRLLGMDELELEEALEPLARIHRLVRPTETRDFPNGDFASVYTFSHSLIQDVLHRNLVGKRRILLHRKAAQILEELYGGETAPIDWHLSFHYEEGRLPEKAYHAAVRAADRAAGVYAHLDAIEQLGRALRQAPGDAERLTVLSRLAEQHRLTGRYPEALELFGDAVEIARDAADREQVIGLRQRMVTVQLDFGQTTAEELLTELEELAAQARELEAKVTLCRILWSFRTLPVSGEATQARRAALEEALTIAQDLDDPGLLARARYALGALLTVSDPPAALPHLELALGWYEENDDQLYVGYCRNSIAVARLLLGEFDEARAAFEGASSAFDTAGDAIEAASVRNNLGALYTRRGDWDPAEATLQEALRVAERLDAGTRRLAPYQNLAELYMERGRPSEARVYWERLREAAMRTGYWTSQMVAVCGTGLVDLDEGRREAAAEALALARELDRGANHAEEAADYLDMLEARLALERGDWAGAAAVCERAEERLERKDPYWWAEFRFLHARSLAQGGLPEAPQVAAEAGEAFRKLDATPKIRAVEASLATMEGEA